MNDVLMTIMVTGILDKNCSSAFKSQYVAEGQISALVINNIELVENEEFY